MEAENTSPEAENTQPQQEPTPAENSEQAQESKTFENRIDLKPLQDSVAQIKSEIAKIIVGQNEMIELLIISILTNGHALIEGVPGVAKTITAKLLAKTLAVDFSRIQFTPDLMPSDILGTSVFNVKSNDFETAFVEVGEVIKTVPATGIVEPESDAKLVTKFPEDPFEAILNDGKPIAAPV